eukprot:CAMPEP_0113818674 /NCGR_PEP_ID=MMETSP0328-20130328/358_1 /TAXON_ID=39455 /ORGANISM="Alexandrium minutum" /LENGTH=527 /DNA_ID=CAMNT_0000786609 /DNA_START=72 /DNA_END=1655 /DNA_ORIENTATION=- /assembly_acc=CAM_ASM_000350
MASAFDTLKKLEGFEIAKETPVSPIEKDYFNGEMLSKYEPCCDALQRIIASDGEDEDVWETFEECFNKFLDFSWISNWDGNKYDLVFYGVSGYTGYLMMQYLKRTAFKRNPEKFTVAFAGRTVSKIAEQRDKNFAGTEQEDTPILAATYDDPVTMIDLARSAHVIINVAGPYMLAQGEKMVDACTICGTDYCDVSGEIPWTLRTMELDDRAKKGKACIIPSSAVAGAYPDVCVFMAARKVLEDTGHELRRAIAYCRGGGASAGSSGGTLATRAAMSSASDDVRKAMADPYSFGGFVPEVDRNGCKEITIQQGTGKVNMKSRKEDSDAILSKVSQCPYTGIWRAPWVYSYFDTRIVRRSNELLANLENKPYGKNLTFQEFMLLPPGALMQAANVKETGGEKIPKFGPSVGSEKELLEQQGKYYKQGEGPPLEELSDAWINTNLYAESTHGEIMKCSLVGCDGYYETARCAVEMAMTLRFDKAELPHKGGVMCAASCGQKWYANRLINSGIKWKMGDWLAENEMSPPDK